MATDIGLDQGRLVQLLRVLERERVVVRTGGDLYFLRDGVDQAAEAMRAEWAEAGSITPRMFCDRFQTTRKYAIPLLEYLDREGVTIRMGDTRRLRSWSQSPAGSGRSSSG
jgi:selenocysteine-specific elongation factor